MKAKLEPRKAGTLPLASRWKSSVPRPAKSSVTLTDRPVSVGTSTVAPNMANICCTPSMNIRGAPSVRASYIGSVPMAFLFIRYPLLYSCPERPRAHSLAYYILIRPAAQGLVQI